MAQFILLLKGINEQLPGYSPEELQKLFGKYDAWVENLRKRDKLRAAQPLKDGIGRVISAQNGRVVDGPFAETKETIGGYFVIECRDIEEAVTYAQSCPILLHGGSVELREITEGCRYS